MTRSKQPEDAFLRDLASLEGETEGASAALSSLSTALGEMLPSTSLRERILTDAVRQDRFVRFAEATARMLDVGLEKAREILNLLEDQSAWSHELPGISFLWVDGGRSVQDAVRGFVRVQAGLQFPDHEHLGNEHVLLIQGSYQDSISGKIFHPGDEVPMSAGTSHAFVVTPNGPDLIKLAVVHKGLRAGDLLYEPR
jgi:ChrR-like protein with cupin domain